MERKFLYSGSVNKSFLIFNIAVSLFYLSWWFIPGIIGNSFLFCLLFFGEVYHVLMAILFWHTVWPVNKELAETRDEILTTDSPSVDIYITVAGENIEIVYQTALAAKKIIYPNKHIYILNDGYVGKKDNWQEIEQMAQSLGINVITRTIPGGAKAGNINNALQKTNGEIICIFDADMVAKPEFLLKTIPYFKNSKTGFVQTPQFYNNRQLNSVTGSSWEQQEFFFGPIMKGKEKSNASFICGTNVAIRREALEQVGGMNEKNIAEDFLTSLSIHQNGWRSYYTTEVLAEGLAPEDLHSYYKQQLRWARGSLEVLFGANPIFKGNLTIAQKIEYLSSALFYFNGLIVLIDIIMPLLFLYFGLQPVLGTTAFFAVFFIPFMFLNLYTLSIVSGYRLTFRAISFTQSSFVIQLQALLSVVLHQKMGFSVTPKSAQSGNFIFLALPHLLYIILVIVGIAQAYLREGINPSVATNISWAVLNIAVFMPFIYAAFSKSSPSYQKKTILKPVLNTH